MYALHIQDAIGRIRHIQTLGDLTQDVVLYDATLRNLQTLSEATQRLPAHLKARYAHIPWSQISDFRNILVHNYLGDIDPLTIAGVVDQHLKALHAAVTDMLDSYSP